MNFTLRPLYPHGEHPAVTYWIWGRTDPNNIFDAVVKRKM
jgi:hypothetical protein